MLTVYPAESWAPRVRAHEYYNKFSVSGTVVLHPSSSSLFYNDTVMVVVYSFYAAR